MNDPVKYRRRILLRAQQLPQPYCTEQTYGKHAEFWGAEAIGLGFGLTGRG